MTRLNPALLIMTIFGVAACSDPGPTTPESASLPTRLQIEEASDSESKSALNADYRTHGTYWGRDLHGNKEAFTLQTNQNAYKMERAVWKFTDDNEGVLPRDLRDTNLAGNTIYDYLPGKKSLVNPFTMLRTEPQTGQAVTPGEVGYLTIQDGWGINVGFMITAWGWLEQSLEIIRYVTGPVSLPSSGLPIKSDGSGHG